MILPDAMRAGHCCVAGAYTGAQGLSHAVAVYVLVYWLGIGTSSCENGLLEYTRGS